MPIDLIQIVKFLMSKSGLFVNSDGTVSVVISSPYTTRFPGIFV